MSDSTVQEATEAVEPQKGLVVKLAEVMAEVGYVEKRGRNTFHNYDYVTEADLVEAVRSKLAERSVVLIPSVEGIVERAAKTAKGRDTTITTVRVQFTFLDGETGETHTALWAGAGDDESDKGLYKAYTGALKYFLMKAFLIPTGDDPEADSGKGNGREATGQVARPTAQPPQATERFATAKQRGLINAKAGEAELSQADLAAVILAASGEEPREFDGPEAAADFTRRAMDRLPARLVDPVLEEIKTAAADRDSVPF